jgi:hypothetical protein
VSCAPPARASSVAAAARSGPGVDLLSSTEEVITSGGGGEVSPYLWARQRDSPGRIRPQNERSAVAVSGNENPPVTLSRKPPASWGFVVRGGRDA